jgi:phosphoribosylformylglycinamidine (FGAM) synthase PurS component
MSGYETARQNAIEKSMKEQKTKKAKSGLAVGIANIKKAKDGMLMSDRDKQVQEQKNKTQAKTMKDKVFNNPRISDQDMKMLNSIFNKGKISDQDMKTIKRFIK